MNHPYRIIVTNGGARSAVISLCRVVPGSMPDRVRNALVERVVMQSRCQLPQGVRTGVCMPERPRGLPGNAYERELARMYQRYDALVAAPNENEVA